MAQFRCLKPSEIQLISGMRRRLTGQLMKVARGRGHQRLCVILRNEEVRDAVRVAHHDIAEEEGNESGDTVNTT